MTQLPPEQAPTRTAEARRFTLVGRLRLRVVLEYAMVFVLVALVIGAAVAYPGFLSLQNLSNIVSQNAPLGLVAIGMTFIIIAAGFDLSVGAIYALTAVVFAGVARDVSLPVAVVVALAVGAAAGAMNGLLVTRFRVNPFVATLGTSSIISGLSLVYSGAYPIFVDDPGFRWLGAERIGGVPVASIILVIAFMTCAFVLHKTTYGRSLFALGGNWEAARLSGIRVDLIRASTYALTGVLTGLAGMMIASRLNVGQPDIGSLLPLDAIAVVVVGGTSLLGGEGSIWRTAVGLAVLAVLTNLFYAMSVDLHWQYVLKGLIIVGAVALDAYVRRLR